MSLDGPDGKHDFAITNNGDAPLRLIAGKSTCQCTQFTLDRDEVGQGETATLTIQWQAKKETASFRHGGIVYTNDPDQTEIKFDVEGIIEAPVMITPQHVWSAGNMTAATPGTIEASLFSRVFPKLTIDNVSAETDVTTVEYFPMTDQKLQENEALCGFTFRVTISPKLSIGELDDTLTISITELPDDIRVPVQATRLGDIRFSPMRGTKFNRRKRLIRLGAFHAANGHKAELMVLVDQDNFNEELKLLEVQSDPTSLKVSLEPIGKPGEVVARYRMTVAILPGGLRLQRSVENAGTIRCFTNHPGEKEIVIRVSFDAH